MCCIIINFIFGQKTWLKIQTNEPTFVWDAKKELIVQRRSFLGKAVSDGETFSCVRLNSKKKIA